MTAVVRQGQPGDVCAADAWVVDCALCGGWVLVTPTQAQAEKRAAEHDDAHASCAARGPRTTRTPRTVTA